MDCGSTLGGKFCHYCGQRKQRRVASAFSLAGEFVGDIFNWDSRVWRTLWPLFFKPGFLTKSYMEGKRERHVPPIRLYLISSIIFFLLVSMSPRGYIDQVSSAIDLKKGDTESALEYGLDTEINKESSRAVIAILQQLNPDLNFSNDDLPITTGDDEEDTEDNRETDATSTNLDDREVFDLDVSIGEDATNVITSSGETSASQADINSDTDQENSGDNSTDSTDGASTDDGVDDDEIQIVTDCDGIRDMEYSPGLEFLRKPAVKTCESMSTWGGLITFIEELIEGLPRTLLVLLPLMALTNKLLFLFAGRYYVEHLLYYVHNYSFLFLFTVVLAAVGKLVNLIGGDISGLLSSVGTLYVIYYFFKSMRVVYEQGFIFTLVKWLTLVLTLFIYVPMILAFFTVATAALHGL
ncbi:MAG: DUF3667 domain-containing protein [Gammaproteobacteria bacterium]